MPVVNPVAEFTDTPLPAAAYARFRDAVQPRVRVELVALDAALNRYLATNVDSPIDLPEFPRSTVDGYAVRAADLAGATVTAPATLSVVGEASMGRTPTACVGAGTAVKIHTGAMLPEGTEAVAMVEWSAELGHGRITINRSVQGGDNTIARGEDVRAGEPLLRAGRRLRPEDIGGLAAIGLVQVPVVRRPVVAIISGGDEVVPAHATPGPAQVRDVNGATLAAMVEATGGSAWRLGIAPDDPTTFTAMAEEALAGADIVIVSGGSSVGTRDVTRAAVDSFGPPGVIVHGVAVRPGKPTLLAVVRDRPFFGLPGNPVSAIATFRLFVQPTLLRYLGVEEPQARTPTYARLTAPVPPSGGREDYVQVRLVEQAGATLAEPVLGKSNLIFTVIRADGYIRVPVERAGLPAGEVVRVWQY
ncbi:MAG TPA: gephyrin-like molybdotransferase Glp [Chloroflexota bacterium]|jgi:molybdopterin molybdotransferase